MTPFEAVEIKLKGHRGNFVEKHHLSLNKYKMLLNRKIKTEGIYCPLYEVNTVDSITLASELFLLELAN